MCYQLSRLLLRSKWSLLLPRPLLELRHGRERMPRFLCRIQWRLGVPRKEPGLFLRLHNLESTRIVSMEKNNLLIHIRHRLRHGLEELMGAGLQIQKQQEPEAVEEQYA